MKNQYVGDKHDFLKYSLLYILSKIYGEGKILIDWMLTPNDTEGEKNGKDGMLTKYDKPSVEEEYHNALYDALQGILERNERCVGYIENNDLLKDRYQFPSDVFLQEGDLRRCQRCRATYFKAATDKEVDLIFFDPDNGIEVDSVKIGNKNSEKYIYMDEIKSVWEKGKDMLIYQHFPREIHSEFIGKTIAKLKDLTNGGNVLAIKTGNVAFFLISKKEPNREELLRDALKPWGDKMTLFTE